MRNTKIFCMMAIVTCLGLGASGCGKYDYDSEQIYTKHKKACEASIDRANGVLYPALSADQIALQIENGELKSYEGQFLYEEGVCECDNTECAVGEVCYEFSDDTVKCVDYMCDEGERKCVENNGFALKFRCEDYKWKAEGFCSVGKCHENGIECAANSSNVMDIDVIEDKIDSECSNGICIEIGSNEFGRKAYMFMPCEEGKMRQDKQEICDYNCNDDEKQGDLGCVQCNINDNICEDDDNHLRACINGEFKRFMCENGCRDGACLEKTATGECSDGDKKCDGNKVKICEKGVWKDDGEECSNGCHDYGNGQAGCNCEGGDFLFLKCEVSATTIQEDGLSKCIDGEWRKKGEDNKWNGTDSNIMDNEAKCVCYKSNVVESLGSDKEFRSICKYCYNDGNGIGHASPDGSMCIDESSCKNEYDCGECKNGKTECDLDVTGAPVLKTCKNGVWEESSCSDGGRCEMNNDGKAECVVDADFDQDCTYLDKRCNESGYIEICQNKEWMNYKEYIKEKCQPGSADCIMDTSDGISSYCMNDDNNNVREWCEQKNGRYEYNHERCKTGSGCNDGVCSGEEECETGKTKCNGNMLKTCVDGKWNEGEDCPNGCIGEEDGNALCVGGGEGESDGSSGYGSCEAYNVGKYKCGYEKSGKKIIAIILKCNNNKWEKIKNAVAEDVNGCTRCGNDNLYDDSKFQVTQDIIGANLCVGNSAYLCTKNADSGKVKNEWIYNNDCSSQ